MMSYKFKSTAADYFNALTDDMIKEAFEAHGFDMGLDESPSINNEDFILIDFEESILPEFAFSGASKVQSLSHYRRVKEIARTKGINFTQHNSHEEYPVQFNSFEQLKHYEEKGIGVEV